MRACGPEFGARGGLGVDGRLVVRLYGDGMLQRFPRFRLDDADGNAVTERDLHGHTAVVYLARHPG
jgi:hypothetical protein